MISIVEQMKGPDIKWFVQVKSRSWRQQPTDIHCSNAKRRDLLSHFHDLKIRNRVLYYLNEDELGQVMWQYVVPDHQVDVMIAEIHNKVLGGHLGVKKTTEKLKARWFRVGWSDAVKKYIRTCDVCQRVKTSGKRSRALMKSIRPILPLELLTTDIAGPLPTSTGGHTHVLVVCDHFTKFVQIYALKDTQALTVAHCLVEFMLKFGICDSLLSDQEKNYQSLLLEAVYELLDVKQLRTTPYHPECDGLSERFIQTMKQMLMCYVNDKGDDWFMFLDQLAFAYNTASQSTTNHTPFELMFGRKPKLPLDLTMRAALGVVEVAVSGPKSQTGQTVCRRTR